MHWINGFGKVRNSWLGDNAYKVKFYSIKAEIHKMAGEEFRVSSWMCYVIRFFLFWGLSMIPGRFCSFFFLLPLFRLLVFVGLLWTANCLFLWFSVFAISWFWICFLLCCSHKEKKEIWSPKGWIEVSEWYTLWGKLVDKVCWFVCGSDFHLMCLIWFCAQVIAVTSRDGKN